MPRPFEKMKLNIKQEERAELMASGKCFICREVGHFARHCPNENNEKSFHSELPGVPNFSIGLEALDEEDSDEVENLYAIRVSAISFCSGGILPEERNIASCMPDWGAEDAIIPSDLRSDPSNIDTLNLPEVTDVLGSLPEHVWELGAQEEAPRAACPIGDVSAAKDLEGARFNPANFRDLIYVIGDNKHTGKADYFAFRGPRQRKEGEGEPTASLDINFLPQKFISFTQAPIAHGLTTPEAANTLLEPTMVLEPLPRVTITNPAPFVDEDDDYFRTEIHNGHRALIPDVAKAVELNNYFLATDLMARDPHADFCLVKKESLLLGPLDKFIPRVKIPSIMSSVFQGFDPAQNKAIVDVTVPQFGATIQAAVRDAVSALKPPARNTVMMPAESAAVPSPVVSGPAVVPSPAARLSQIAPVVFTLLLMITDDDGIHNGSYKFNFNGTFAIFNPRAGVPIVPDDPINIGDFRIDEDLVELSERPYSRSEFGLRSEFANDKETV
jgi:hypothetical protein